MRYHWQISVYRVVLLEDIKKNPLKYKTNPLLVSPLTYLHIFAKQLCFRNY